MHSVGSHNLYGCYSTSPGCVYSLRSSPRTPTGQPARRCLSPSPSKLTTPRSVQSRTALRPLSPSYHIVFLPHISIQSNTRLLNVASCVLPKLRQHTITMRCSIHPYELQATLYSSSAGMKFHLLCGSGISMKLRVTCGENGVSIDTQSSIDLPYRFIAGWLGGDVLRFCSLSISGSTT